MSEMDRSQDQIETEAATDPTRASAEPPQEGPEEAISPPLDLSQIRVGRLDVPEDADDILAFVHRQPGVVHVWMTGDILSVESEPGAFDCDGCIEQLADRGFRVSSAFP